MTNDFLKKSKIKGTSRTRPISAAERGSSLRVSHPGPPAFHRRRQGRPPCLCRETPAELQGALGRHLSGLHLDHEFGSTPWIHDGEAEQRRAPFVGSEGDVHYVKAGSDCVRRCPPRVPLVLIVLVVLRRDDVRVLVVLVFDGQRHVLADEFRGATRGETDL